MMARMEKDWNARFGLSKPVRRPSGWLTGIGILLVPVCYFVSILFIYLFAAGAYGSIQWRSSTAACFTPMLLPIFLIYLDFRPRSDNR